MQGLTVTSEIFMRLGFFFGILIVIMLWEKAFPRREQLYARLKRWPSNLGIVFVNSVLLRLIFPVAAMGVAAIAAQGHWGLLNNIPAPYWLAVIVSVIFLDFVIYLQHVMFHALPIFWRMHRMHHTDLDYDVTTGLRFHPIEIILSMLIKMSAVVVLGAPVLAVFIFEVLLNATSMFNHGNIMLPLKLDRVLRRFVVTPDMHRVHHSVIMQETNSNFGFNLPWWDRICGTYKSQPREGHTGMTIGLNIFRNPKFLKLNWLLVLPFMRKSHDDKK